MRTTLPYMGFIRIAGKDAAKFLQGQLTCNLQDVTATRSLVGAYCSQQGRTQATFSILNLDDCYYLYLPVEIIPAIIALLQRYAVFSKVTITDASTELSAIGLAGESIPAMLQNQGYQLPILDHAVLQTQGVWLVKLPGARYLLIANSNISNHIAASLTINHNAKPWEVYDIEQGFPIIFLATMDQFTPQVLQLDRLGGISFNKGCYIGQEVIARIHYRGQVKQQLKRAVVRTTDTIGPGDKVMDQTGAAIGTIINASKCQDNAIALLVVLPQAVLQPEQWYVANAQLTLLPFSDT